MVAAVRNIRLEDVLRDPEEAADAIRSTLYGASVVCRLARGGVVFDLRFTALPGLPGFGDECARVSVRPDGSIYAFPLGSSERLWKHRQPSPCGSDYGYVAAELCLFYPSDPRSLRWEWSDGLLAYIARVQRHLFFEEQWRRTGRWPVEDAPHGDPAVGAHPVVTRFMQREERRWSRISHSAS